MLKTVNISMTEEDLEAIDRYCMAHNLTRSKFMLQSTLQALDVERLYNATVIMNQALQEYKDKGIVEADDVKLLDAVETIMGGYFKQ